MSSSGMPPSSSRRTTLSRLTLGVAIAGVLAATTTLVNVWRESSERSGRTRDQDRTRLGDVSTPTAIPLFVLRDFAPTGWIGDGIYGREYLKLTNALFGNFKRESQGPAGWNVKVSYKPGPQGWAGVYWQYPPSNWGDRPGRNLSRASVITFLAAGETGLERVTFLAGGNDPTKPYGTRFEVGTGVVRLAQQWSTYSMSLEKKDLTSVTNGFGFTVTAADDPDGATFFLKDVAYR